MTAPSFVSGQHGFAYTDGTTANKAVSLPSTVGTGNTIVLFIKVDAASVIASVLDDKGNALTVIDNTTGGAGGANQVRTYYRTNCTDAPQSVTVTATGTLNYPRIILREFTGGATDSSVINAHEIRSFNSSSTATDALTSAGSAVTTVADTCIVAFLANHSSSNGVVAGTGFSAEVTCATPPNNYDILYASQKTQAVAGAAHALFTAAVGAATDWSVAMVALAPPVTGYTLTASPKAVTATGVSASLTLGTVTPGEVADADFVQFLAGPLAKTVLCNLDYGYDAGGDTPAVATARLSNRRYATRSTDSPASTPYRDVLRDAPTFSRQINRDTLDGFATLTVSQIVFDNSDGDMFWLLDAVIDGYKVDFRVGFGGDDSEPWRVPWAYTDFRRIFTAYMERAEINSRGEITVYVRGADALADKGIVGESIADAVSTVPICVGTVALIRSFEEDHALLIYRYADAGFLYSPMVSDVRDTGEPLGGYLSPGGFATYAAVSDTSGDRIEITGLIVWTIAVNDVMRIVGSAPSPLVVGDQYWVVDTDGSTWFEVSATRGGSPLSLTPGAIFNIFRQGYFDNHDGTMTMSATPVGDITCSVQNRGLPGGRTDKFSDLYWWAWVEAAGLDEADFAGAHDSYLVGDAVLDDRNGGVVVQQRRNVISIIDGIARSSASFCGTSLSGKFTFGRINTNPLDRPSTSSATFGEDSVLDDLQCPRLAPKYSAVATFAGLNYQPLTQIVEDPTISDKTRDRLKSKGQAYTVVEESGTSYDDAPSRWHRTMTRSPDFENLAMSAGASWPQYIRLRFAPHIEFLLFDAPFSKAYRLELGDRSTVYMPTYCGHTEDTYWQVLGHSFQLLRGGLFQDRISLVLVRRRIPSVA